MKKKLKLPIWYVYSHKILLIMRLSFFLCLIGAFQISATSLSQTTKINLHLDNVDIREAFREIERSSGFSFLLFEEASNFKKNISISASNKALGDVMDELLKNTDFQYKILDNRLIVISPETAVQQKKISGMVTDAVTGEPLIGVNVVVEGTTIGAVTDINGKYTLNLPSDEAILVFSYIGYNTEKTTYSNQAQLDVKLVPDIKKLDEIVVIGFGTQKRATVTGAVASVSTKQLLQSPQANISNALVGRMPGLLSVQRSGEPGKDESTLRIRGVGTFSGSADPLIMVDGVESQSYNNIDPNEIESISILKDASATAVYGVRGANGVLLITTKRGKEGKVSISYSANYAINKFTDIRKQMNAGDYTSSYNAALKNDGFVTGGYTEKYSADDIAKYKSHEDPIFYPDIDWTGLFLKPSTGQMQHNLNISGGTEKSKYFISGGYFTQEGLYDVSKINYAFDAQSKYKRYNFRSNFDFEVTKRLKLIFNFATQIENIRGNAEGATSVFGTLSRANPINTPGIIDGKLVTLGRSNTFNPYSYLVRSGYSLDYKNSINTSVRLNYDLSFITKGLGAHGILSYENFYRQIVTYSKVPVTYLARKLDDGSLGLLPQAADSPFGFDEKYEKYRRIYGEFGIDYTRTFDSNHTITGLVLYNQSKKFDPRLAFSVPSGYQGLVGRVTYDYKHRYLAEFNVGYNGSENFPKEKRFGFFPAYSLGWTVSEESFFPKNNVVSFLKVRGSLGEVGNDQIGTGFSAPRFLYLPASYTYGGGYYLGELGTNQGTIWPGASAGKLENPYLTWERAKKLNIGGEATLFNDKIKLTLDWFNEKRDNILANPGSTNDLIGANLPAFNLGKMKNSGWDGEIACYNNFGKFNYWLKANYTYAHNVVEFQDEAPRLYSYQYRTGQRYGQYFGLIAEGFYNTWDEVNDPKRPVSQWNSNKLQPGDVKYRDVNGDGKITDDDQVPIGYSNFPEVVYGLSLGGDFKGFDFSVLFQGADRVSYAYRRSYQNGFNNDAGTPDYLMTSWTQERYNEGLPIEYPRFSVSQPHNYQGSTFWNRSASYLRLKNIEVGYTLDKNFLKKIRIESLRVYVNGNNLITWSSMLPGVDPETPDNLDVNKEPYPITKIFNFGLNVKF